MAAVVAVAATGAAAAAAAGPPRPPQPPEMRKRWPAAEETGTETRGHGGAGGGRTGRRKAERRGIARDGAGIVGGRRGQNGLLGTGRVGDRSGRG